jgi:hypothetical protein
MIKVNQIGAHPRGLLLLFAYLYWYFIVRYSSLIIMSLAKCILVDNLLLVIGLIVFHHKELYVHMKNFVEGQFGGLYV